ncbi:hypothetical protein LXL04_028343 [Taraxacum kok-saghyz]
MSGMMFGGIPSALVSKTSSSSDPPPEAQSNQNVDYNLLPTGYKLNGQNYSLWSHSISILIGGKGKEEYLSSELVQPEEKNPTFKRWKSENSMVMSWLLNSMLPDIGEQFMFYKKASEIWEAAVTPRFSYIKNII